MKFGKALLKNQVDAWSDNYIAYKRLKKLVAEAITRRKRLGVQSLPADDTARIAFFHCLEDELHKMNAFFVAQVEQTSARCRDLAALHSVISAKVTSPPTSPEEVTCVLPWHDAQAGVEPAGLPPSPAAAETSSSSTPAVLAVRNGKKTHVAAKSGGGGGSARVDRRELESLLEEALDLKAEVDALAIYQRINLEGARKILKKYDKRLKDQSQSSFFAKNVASLPLGSPNVLSSIEALVAKIVTGAHASVEDGKSRVCEWKTYSF